MEAGPSRLRLCSPGVCGGSRADAIGRRPPVGHPRCCQSRDAHGRGSTGQDQITRTISPPLITPLLGWKNSLKSSVRRELERTVCPVASAARLLAWRHDRAAGSGNRLPEPLQTACTTPSPPGLRGTSSGPDPQQCVVKRGLTMADARDAFHAVGCGGGFAAPPASGDQANVWAPPRFQLVVVSQYQPTHGA